MPSQEWWQGLLVSTGAATVVAAVVWFAPPIVTYVMLLCFLTGCMNYACNGVCMRWTRPRGTAAPPPTPSGHAPAPAPRAPVATAGHPAFNTTARIAQHKLAEWPAPVESGDVGLLRKQTGPQRAGAAFALATQV